MLLAKLFLKLHVLLFESGLIIFKKLFEKFIAIIFYEKVLQPSFHDIVCALKNVRLHYF